ncbi:MAG: hypothetical protein KGR16_04415 [Verrucomicrobia bacterium]|nr:hypothetical protein [Verrucomicrobiota bacterium]
MIYFFLLFFSFLYAQADDQTDITMTNHTVHLESGPLEYVAIAGHCPIFQEDQREVDLFFIAYCKATEEDRPITFCFPGGPGCAGTAEAILTFGPRRLLTAAEGRSIHPPYQLIDNPETLLEYTDLVYVDPPGCGFSWFTEEADSEDYFSVEKDIQTLGAFIRTVIDELDLWNSPIYLSGVSYGTLRCCGLAQHLLQDDIPVKGILLDGCAFEFSTLLSARDKAVADWLLIPTCAATAWYHGRLWPDKSLEEVVDYARQFAYDRYALYMLQPGRLSVMERMGLFQELSILTGLPMDTVKRYNGRIDESIFASEFFGPERKILGRLDSRYIGDIASIDPKDAHDPSGLDGLGVLPAFFTYLNRELDTHFSYKRYVGFSQKALHDWNFGTWDAFGEPSLLQRLRLTLILNPRMSVFISAGYYDCRTPFAAAEYCFDHLDLPLSYQQNLQFEYYETGHGVHGDYQSLKKLKQDLIRFYMRK